VTSSSVIATVLAAVALAATPGPLKAQSEPVHGLDLAAMDRSVPPGDDFFAYANGTWFKTAEIAPDLPIAGAGAELVVKTREQVADLIKQTAAQASTGGEARKVADYYNSFLDEARIDRLGMTPIAPVLSRIAAIRSRNALAAELGRELRADVDALNNTHFQTANLFGLWVEQDLNDPALYAPYLLQGGLGLPDRDYYLADNPHMAEIRAAYKAHLAKVLTLMGAKAPDTEAQDILDLETKIARTHATREDSEDVHKANNPWSRADFPAKAPGLDWAAYFSVAGLEGQPNFIVWHPQAVAGEAALVANVPLSTWRDYLALHQVEHFSRVLPKAFRDERFAFYDHILSGIPQQPERWKLAVDSTNAALGEAVGKLYVARYFPPESKAAIEAMVKDLIAAYRIRIGKLTWMAPATKAQALRKLDTLKVGVGYPDRWIDYSGLTVTPGDAFGNLQRAELFNLHRNLAKFGRPVDRGEWAMSPQTVNAVNLPVRNALNFPAAYLQAPHFDPKASKAVNYGAIGSVIGHEISHSFDDQGALFDAQGRLRNWWTPEDFAHFRASGRALAEQFSRYHPFPDLALNGQQELSENIADVAGLSAAYDAYRIANGGGQGPALQDLSGDQQFFLSFAQSWRAKYRDALLRLLVATDGHAPAEFRADTVRNIDPWYDAFDVKPGQKLYLAPDDRVRVW
jgi:predicted metalloendopeptidase